MTTIEDRTATDDRPVHAEQPVDQETQTPSAAIGIGFAVGLAIVALTLLWRRGRSLFGR